MAKHTEPTFSITHYIRCKDIYAVVGEKNNNLSYLRSAYSCKYYR